MGAGFCSLHQEIHYIEVRFIEVWGIYYSVLKVEEKLTIFLPSKLSIDFKRVLHPYDKAICKY